MVLSMENLVSLALEFFLACSGQIMDRLSRRLIEKETGRVQVLLDLLKAEHVANSTVMEDNLIVALPIIMADPINVLALALPMARQLRGGVTLEHLIARLYPGLLLL